MLRLQAQSSRAFRNALTIASKCLASKNTMAILDNVLISQKDSKLFFTTASSESQLTIPAPLSITGGKFEQTIALPVAEMLSLLNTLPECVVNMTLEDSGALSITYCIGSDDKVREGKAQMMYKTGEDFPQLVGLRGEEIISLSLPGALFNNAMQQASIFSCRDEVRLVMNGLCVDVREDGSECYLVATDGRAFYKRTVTPADGFVLNGSKTGKLIIHNAFVKPLSAFAGAETVMMETDGHSLRFTSGDIEFVCKAIEGNYPNYNAIIPHSNPYYMVVDKKELLETVKRVSVFGSTDSNLVVLRKDGMFLNISSSNNEFARKSDEQVFLSDFQCDDNFEIGFSSIYLANALSAIENDTVRLQLSDPSRPGICTAEEANPRVLTLCMPMRVE